MKFLHLSDLHLRTGWHEEQGAILRRFSEDLQKQLPPDDSNYLIFSGDFVQSAADDKFYSEFLREFDELLNSVGIPYARRFCVPGNHDVSQDFVRTRLRTLRAVVSQQDTERSFNDAIYTEYKDFIAAKFTNYFNFEKKFAAYGCGADTFTGCGHSLDEKIGLYALNTALFSFAGCKTEDGESISDKESLAIDTRRLYAWVDNSNHQYRILVMHHPLEWLRDWARREFEQTLSQFFDIIVHGHIHDPYARDVHNVRSNTLLCSAPPLFTRKAEMLGYTIIEIQPELAGTSLKYRQAGRSLDFVSGSYFSNTDDGLITFKKKQLGTSQMARALDGLFKTVEGRISAQFYSTIMSTRSAGSLWVLPTLADRAEIDASAASAEVVSPDRLATSPTDCVILAPPQFGLSSLGAYLALAAWRGSAGALIAVLHSPSMPNHETGIQAYVENYVSELGLSLSYLTAFVIDEFELDKHTSIRQINNLKRLFPNLPIIALARIDDQFRIGNISIEKIAFAFNSYYLWQLSREQIRELARQYAETHPNVSESFLVDKVTNHLDVLNLHRTALNCVTLFCIAEAQIDESPINRTSMIEQLLFIIFNDFDNIPKYSTIPDLKDATYALGFLCEKINDTGRYEFTRPEFFSWMGEYCEAKLISFDADVLFSILVNSNILMARDGFFRFRFTYWFYFFTAQRMYHEEAFFKRMLSDRKYARFPEIIEFFSGIDRRRADLLELLHNDLEMLNNRFVERSGFSNTFNPLSALHWETSESEAEQLATEIQKEVEGSGLPVSIKDMIADRSFDRKRSYVQELQEYYNDASMRECLRVMRSAALAFRNSDHVDADVKRRILDEILVTWRNLTALMIGISPILAVEDEFSIENMHFVLTNIKQYDDVVERLYKIISVIPHNVVGYFEKDVGSKKLAQVFYDFIERSDDELTNHLVLLLLLRMRPSGWRKVIKDHLHKHAPNSYYLADLFSQLRAELQVSYLEPREMGEVKELIGIAFARHKMKSKKPNKKQVMQALTMLKIERETTKK